MHRQKLINQLLDYKAFSTDESGKVDRILDFVNANPDCFKRELLSGHITGSSWLLNKSGDQALLGLHKKLGIWIQPGGHADGESDILNVALREAQEESGIEAIEPITDKIFDVDVHLIPARPGEPEHYHYDIRYLLRVTDDSEFQKNDEMKALRWITPESVNEMPNLDISIMRMIAKWQNLSSVEFP